MHLGLDVGGSAIKWVLLEGEDIVDSGSEPTPTSGVSDVLDALQYLLQCHSSKIDPSNLIGLALPGSLDPGTSQVQNFPNLIGDWTGLFPGQWLSERTGFSWKVVNDARAFAAGELLLGVARDSKDVIFVALGTGVGGALALNGALSFGSKGLIGEIGHVIVEPEGRPCGCGSRGCLDAYAGAAGILAEADRRGWATTLTPGQRSATMEDLIYSADQGDAIASSLISEAAESLGSILARLSTFLVPDLIVLGGGLSESASLLTPLLKDVLERDCRLFSPPRIALSQLGRNAGAIGAACFAAGFIAPPISTESTLSINSRNGE